MNMKRLILLLIILCLALSGCSPLAGRSDKQEGILYKVTDSTGTELFFSEKPRRIVSLNVSADEVLLDLVDNTRLAALSALSDDPGICSAAEKAKHISGRVYGNNIEGILIYQPDLVIVPNYDSNTINALRSSGLKTYVYKTPSNMDEIFRFIKDLGDVTGETEKYGQMAATLKQRLEKVRSTVNAAVAEDKKLSVMMLSFNGPIGMKGTFSDVCYYAGVKNCLADIDIPFQNELSQEKMLELDPDIIVTPSWDYSKQGDPEVFRNNIINNPLYQDIKAVKNNRVIRVRDNDLYSTSQYTVNAVEELARKAYPELFSKSIYL